MTRWCLWLFVPSMCIACGAHSSSEPTDVTSGAGGNTAQGAGGASVMAGDSSNAGNGATANDSGGSGSPGDPSGGMSDAGEPGYMPHIGSGTRNCESANYCFGLSCYAPPSFEPTVCVARCETDWDCEASEICVRSALLEPTCYASCDSPTDCAHHFDCVELSGRGQAVCFPTGWAGRIDELDN